MTVNTAVGQRNPVARYANIFFSRCNSQTAGIIVSVLPVSITLRVLFRIQVEHNTESRPLYRKDCVEVCNEGFYLTNSYTVGNYVVLKPI
jgi:hypothetical protein